MVEEGEGSKTYAGLEKVSEALIAARIERNDLVIALGGGVVGDLAGFAAAILRRGVDFVQVPTSLLAQVDSSVGGKTGINSPQGKNLLGAFHQPVLVIADTAVLDTLSPRQFRAGYAEVAKYGLLGDEAFFAWLEKQPWRCILRRRGARARDRHLLPRQGGDRLPRRARDRRAGAAQSRPHLWACAGSGDRFLRPAVPWRGRCRRHGAGRGIFRAARQDLRQPTRRAIRHHLATVGLPTRLQDIAGFAQEGLADADALMALMAQDKKVKRGKLTFILLEAIGRAVIAHDVEPALVRDFLQQKLSG